MNQKNKNYTKKKYVRFCPSCNKEIVYKSNSALWLGNKRQSNCKSCAVKGENNPMYNRIGELNHFYGKTHTKETKKKLSQINKGRKVNLSNEIKEKRREQAKINLVQGNVYDYWVEKHGQIIADEKMAARRKKISSVTKGKNNPMHGRPAPQGSGNGWSGWYKNIFFRSLRELKYMLDLDANKQSWMSAECKKYKIEYVDYKGQKRNYFPDFIVDNKYIVECKPKRLWNSPLVVLKKTAAEKKFKTMGLKYVLIDPGKLNNKKIKHLIETKQIILTNKYENKYKEHFL